MAKEEEVDDQRYFSANSQAGSEKSTKTIFYNASQFDDLNFRSVGFLACVFSQAWLCDAWMLFGGG